MRVRDVCSGEILEINACYAARLVEQGTAVVVRDGAGEVGEMPNSECKMQNAELGVIPGQVEPSVGSFAGAQGDKGFGDGGASGCKRPTNRRKRKGEADGAGG